MLRTLTFTKVATAAGLWILGANQGLTLGHTSAGGGQFTLSGSPTPDPMLVQYFGATLADTNSRPQRGYRLVLGLLGEREPIPLHEGIVGDLGNVWVSVPRHFGTSHGLWVQLPEYVPTGTFYLKAKVSYECA